MPGIQAVLFFHLFTEEPGIGQQFLKLFDQKCLNAPVIFGHDIPFAALCLCENAMCLQHQLCCLPFRILDGFAYPLIILFHDLLPSLPCLCSLYGI